MNNGNGVSRGDRIRNARLARLRVLVPVENAIVGIDLADKKQMVEVTHHDSKVLARKTFRCRVRDAGVVAGPVGGHVQQGAALVAGHAGGGEFGIRAQQFRQGGQDGVDGGLMGGVSIKASRIHWSGGVPWCLSGSSTGDIEGA